MNKLPAPANGGPRQPKPGAMGPVTSNLTLAELSLQRSEFQQAKTILEQRISNGAEDFKTLNLYAISLAQLKAFDLAESIFIRLGEAYQSRNLKAKAGFNLGLVRFYQDLMQTGDLSIAQFSTVSPGFPSRGGALLDRPFEHAIATWEALLRRRPPYKDIILTYLSYAHLQAGNLEQALDHIRKALSRHENFYITHFVLGRIFLDLFYLAWEGNDLLLTQEWVEFFEIEEEEVYEERNGRFAVYRDTFLDIAMQAFLEARTLNNISAEVLLGLFDTYMLASMYEEANEILSQVESLAPESLATLEASLRFHEVIQSPPQTILTLVNRIRSLGQEVREDRIYSIMPAYFIP